MVVVWVAGWQECRNSKKGSISEKNKVRSVRWSCCIIESSMYFLFSTVTDLAGSKDQHENFICGDCDTGGGVPNLSLGAQYFFYFWLLQIFGWKARIQCEDCHFWGILALLDLCSSGMIRLGTVRNEGLHSRKSGDGYPDFWGWRRCRHRPREDAEVPRDSRCALFALDQWVSSKFALHLSNNQWLFSFIFWTTLIARRLVTPTTIIKHYKWWLGFMQLWLLGPLLAWPKRSKLFFWLHVVKTWMDGWKKRGRDPNAGKLRPNLWSFSRRTRWMRQKCNCCLEGTALCCIRLKMQRTHT